MLGAVLPSPFVVNATGTSTPNSDLITQSELVDTKPETIVYTLNPKAVWSDGVPITADDFVYAWEQQRGDAALGVDRRWLERRGLPRHRVGHGIERRPHRDGHLQDRSSRTGRCFSRICVPAHVMEKVGWNPNCATVDPAIDLSGGPFEIARSSGQTIELVKNPKWWGTPANARSITVHVAASTDELAQWMTTGYVQVAQPTTVTPSFLTR